MSINDCDDGRSLSSGLDNMESPRKRMRIESPARKSWSLTDRKTDQEVLQEMGVSFLDSDENEQPCETEPSIVSPQKPNLKRKYDIENVNPNVIITSPRSRHSPRSPRGKVCSPDPGPSKGKSPRSCEKSKPPPTSDLESTLLQDYIIDEETPMGQSVAATRYISSPCYDDIVELEGNEDRDSRSPTPLLQLTNELPGVDSFSVLSDEMMLSVFRWLPKRTLAHCMLVCKRWHRVACDETLWQRLDLGNKTLNKHALGRILTRLPIIVRLASSEIGEWHPTSPPETSRVQYLDLSMSTIDPHTLDCLLERCSLVKKLSLESIKVQDSSCRLIGQCKNLETLNLTMAQGITAEGLTAILEGCISLQSLNISWCNLSESALEVLVSKLPQKLQRLNLGGARILTDDMVISLTTNNTRLLELDLSDCSRLGSGAVLAVCSLPRLEHLALSRCYLLPPHVLTYATRAGQSASTTSHTQRTEPAASPPSAPAAAGSPAEPSPTQAHDTHVTRPKRNRVPPKSKLSSMPCLQYLEVWGMLGPAALNALRAALPAIQINQYMFSAIARPTVGHRRTSIWGLRTRD